MYGNLAIAKPQLHKCTSKKRGTDLLWAAADARRSNSSRRSSNRRKKVQQTKLFEMLAGSDA